MEGGLAEACYHHQVGLMAFSPLAGGALTGKYRDEIPPETRFSNFHAFMERYLTKIHDPIESYCAVAQKHDLSPTQLALSWCFHNKLVCTTLLGATHVPQLHENLQALDIRLNDDVSRDVQQVYAKYTDPTKEYY